MIIIKRKLFSGIGNFTIAKRPPVVNPESEPQTPRDADIMVKAGKVGLGTAGVLGAGTVIEGGRSLYHLGKTGKTAKTVLRDMTDNKELQNKLLKAGEIAASKVGIGDIPGATREAAKSYIRNSTEIAKNLKHSPIGRIKLVGRIWKGLGNEKVPRFILVNSEYLTKEILAGATHDMSEKTKEQLKNVPKLAKHAANSGLHYRNMKYLGKGAAGLATLGGILYVNGRSLQDPRTVPNRRYKKRKGNDTK